MFRTMAYPVMLGVLAACGGGGGGSAPTTTSGTPPPPVFTPRTAPTATVLNTPDPPGYAAARMTYESSPEYEVHWQVAQPPSTSAGPDIVMEPDTTGVDRHLRTINAAAAYARGATGAGETVVVVDSGLRETHREFSSPGKTRKDTHPGYTPSGQNFFHGTYVSALAVGRRDEGANLNMHGVAFDANLYFYEIPLGSGGGGGDYTPVDLNRFFADREEQSLLDIIAPAIRNDWGPIINFSFGVPGAISEYSLSETFRLAPIRELLSQAGTDPADKKIIVWAAGNAGNARMSDGQPPDFSTPELLAGLPLHFPVLQTHVLAVVAVDQDGVIADYSNRCGMAKQFCLAAPGSNIVSALYTDDEDYGARVSGTSLAAPLVSGSLAVLRQYFRGQLGNTELVDRLLATANRQGIYADEDIYGHGLLDLDAATRPVGALRTSLPGDPDGRAFAGSGIDLSGGAFGTSLGRRLGGMDMVVFDELGAPFPATLAGRVRRQARNGQLPRALRVRRAAAQFGAGTSARLELAPHRSGRQADEVLLSFAPMLTLQPAAQPAGAGWWLSWGRHDGLSLGLYRDDVTLTDRFLDRAAFAAPWLSLVRDGPAVGAVAPLPFGGRMAFAVMRGTPGDEGAERSGGAAGTGVIMEYQPGSTSLSLQTGFVHEADGFLGTRPRGAFGAVSGATTFAGFNHHWPLTAAWRVLAAGYVGWTRPDVRAAGLLRGVSRLRSSAFSLGLERRSWWRAGDRVGIRISQPLRVESGVADLRLASGRTRYGDVLYRRQRVNLAPSGRRLQAEATWRGPFAGGSVFMSLGAERHADQDARRAVEFLGALRFERAF